MSRARSMTGASATSPKPAGMCGLLLGLACAASVSAQSFVSDRRAGVPNVTPAQVEGLDLQNRLGASLSGDIEFRDSSGAKVKLGDLFNQPMVTGRDPAVAVTGPKKPIVLQMMYYRCPLLCPMVLDRFTKSMRELEFTVGKEFDAVVISFDPRDTQADAQSHKAAALLGYGGAGRVADAGRGGEEVVSKSYHFWLSEPENARRLAAELGFSFRYLPENGEYAHGAVVFVITPEGKVSRYLTGLDYPSKDLRLALIEASNGSIGSWSDRLMLRCFHFDPAAGGYTLQAMRLMQGVSIVSVLALGGFIFKLSRRRSARPALAGGSASDSLVVHSSRLPGAAFEGQAR